MEAFGALSSGGDHAYIKQAASLGCLEDGLAWRLEGYSAGRLRHGGGAGDVAWRDDVIGATAIGYRQSGSR